MEKRQPHNKDIYEIDHEFLNHLANLVAKSHSYLEVFETMQKLDQMMPVRLYEPKEPEIIPHDVVLDSNMKSVD